MANWNNILKTAREEGYSMKVRPTEEGTELVLTRGNENEPGEEKKSFLVLGINSRADEVIEEIKKKR